MQYQDHCQTAADVRRAARDVIARRRLRERQLAETKPAEVKPPKPLQELPDRELVALIVPARARILELLKAPEPPKCHQLREIMAEICHGFALQMHDLIGDRQDRRASVPRAVSYLLCQMLTPASSTRIGQVHGGRDHSTILTQIKKLEWLRQKLSADLTSEDSVPAWVHAAIGHLNSRWEDRE